MSNGDKAVEVAERQDRATIARRIVYGSTIGLMLLAAMVIIAVALTSTSHLRETTQMVFTAILPLIGTWVGTILAYYFSKDNFQAASQSFINTVKELTPDEKLRSIPVRKAMLPVSSIKAVRLSAGQSEKDIKLEILKDFLVGVVTRIPILDDKGVTRYVIHQSMLYKFLAEESLAKGQGFQLNTTTLEDFLNFNGMKDYVSKTLAFVALDQNLADAKAIMEGVKDCQDVFVTEHGKPDEPVMGWLTNIEIAKNAKV